MPPVQILPTAQPHPYAGQNAAAFQKILQTLGQYEGMRQQRTLQSNVLTAIEQGGEPQQILMNIASAMQQPTTYDTGPRGVFQKIGSMFAPPTGMGMTDTLLKGTISQALTRRSKIKELTDEGYTPEQARMIRDISHGIKPRASTRQTYKNMTEVEKLDFLTKVKQRAEGQYYGVLKAEAETEAQGRKVQPREPKVLDWVNSELEKLDIYKSQAGLVKTLTPGFLGRKESEFPTGFPSAAKPLGLGEKEAKGDVKLNTEPPPMRGKITNWMAFPKEIRKQIWQAYERGWRPEEILQAIPGQGKK